MSLKLAFLFLVTRAIERKDYWDKFMNFKKSNYYFHNDKISPEKQDYKFPNQKIISTIKSTKWGYILDATIELLITAFRDKENEFFIICSESCIPIISFDLLYEYLFTKKKNIIDIWKMDKYSQSKVVNINKNHIKHSAFWILKRSMVSKILQNKKFILKTYNFESGEEYFLSQFYNLYKNEFIVKQSTYANWDYNKDKIKKLYLQMKQSKTDDEYLEIKKKIGILGSHPKSYIDIIPKEIFEKKAFFARKFILSKKEIFLKNYQIENIIIISGLQRSGNHLFSKMIIESLNTKVFYINDINKKKVKNIFDVNLFYSLIYNGHYLSKNINNLIDIKDLQSKKIFNLVLTTEEYYINEIELLYKQFKNFNLNKIFIMRDILNLTASRLEFNTKRIAGFPMYTDKLFINNWLEYFNYVKANNDVLMLNYNKFVIKKHIYIKEKFEIIGINFKHNIDIKKKTLFGKGSSFDEKDNKILERYRKYINHKTIQLLLKNNKIMKILEKYFLFVR